LIAAVASRAGSRLAFRGYVLAGARRRAEHKFAAPSRLRVRSRCGGDPDRSPPRVLLAWEPGTSTNPEIVREEIDEGEGGEEDGGAAPEAAP
jgi:hypothetical protein